MHYQTVLSSRTSRLLLAVGRLSDRLVEQCLHTTSSLSVPDLYGERQMHSPCNMNGCVQRPTTTTLTSCRRSINWQWECACFQSASSSYRRTLMKALLTRYSCHNQSFFSPHRVHECVLCCGGCMLSLSEMGDLCWDISTPSEICFLACDQSDSIVARQLFSAQYIAAYLDNHYFGLLTPLSCNELSDERSIQHLYENTVQVHSLPTEWL